ncbi:hypothetical protein GYH30_033369 [Glycine max]|uniref:Uncharacterized protein n=1 Tax=Glycine max TaxID=3847 RepID=A0A0R0H407_SOYBN|nr:hypothetical protein GYH30_033369 [Glycine max]
MRCLKALTYLEQKLKDQSINSLPICKHLFLITIQINLPVLAKLTILCVILKKTNSKTRYLLYMTMHPSII